MLSRVTIFVLLAVILGVPFFLRPAAEVRPKGADVPTLVIVTPHVPQIRTEFADAFSRWHNAHYGTPVHIDYRVPGGTSDILKQLEAQFAAAGQAGLFDFTDPSNPKAAPGTTPFDLMFGGGSFDHGRVKSGVKIKLNGVERTIPMSVPAGLEKSYLQEMFGENVIGTQTLYDPDQYWIGAALSGFGIVYNKEIYARLGLPAPESFTDLTSPKLQGWVILADPRQSGSVATTLDSILSYYSTNDDWSQGWRVIREMCANARTFTASSTKPPIDVSAGEAAVGLAIDFYGRGQAQSVVLPGADASTSRVGYVDPKGAVYIDADPISILRGGGNFELAQRFVRFCLSDEGQALWQFHALDKGKGADNPTVTNPKGERVTLGPEQYELRRMPVRRSFYREPYAAHLIDQVDPFLLATEQKPRGWRSALGVMMGAFAIDVNDELRTAWAVLNKARETQGFSTETLAAMETAFYAMPDTRVAKGTEVDKDTVVPEDVTLAFTPQNYKVIRAFWRKRQSECEVAYTAFFRDQYAEVERLGREGFAQVRASGGVGMADKARP